MDFYRELEALKTLNGRINRMNSYLRMMINQSGNKKGKAAEQKSRELIQQVQGTIEILQTLQQKLTQHYTPLYYNSKKFRRVRPEEAEELKGLYELAGQSVTATMNGLFPTQKLKDSKAGLFFRELDALLKRDQRLVSRINAADRLSLPEAVFKANSELTVDRNNRQNIQYKWPGFFEYESLFLTDPNVTHEDALRMYMSKTPEQIRQEYQRQVAANPRFYEYPRERERIDPKIRNTGNVQKINQYLQADDEKQNPEDKLTFRERQMLIHHRDATEKVKQIQDSVQAKMQAGQELGRKPKFRRNDEQGVILDVHLPAFQTSSNGCWSCAGALLAGSRGVSQVSQEDIRNYRPDIRDDEVVPPGGDLDENYNYDYEKSLTENADSILQHAPNSMLHSLTISNYSEDNNENGFTREDYVTNAVNLLKKQIDHALRVDRSPVSYYRPGHYITIVGLEGDEVLFKDSYNSGDRKTPPDHSYRVTLKQLVEDNFFGQYGPRAIDISWISDIKLAKDNKTIHGVPSQYVYMREDGSVTQQPEAMREAMGLFNDETFNRIGINVGRPAEDEDVIFSRDRNNKYGSAGVQMSERVYLPKQLNADYLKRMAVSRKAEEEEKLNTADREIFHIREGKIDPQAAEAEMRRRLREINNEAVPGGNPDVEQDQREKNNGNPEGKPEEISTDSEPKKGTEKAGSDRPEPEKEIRPKKINKDPLDESYVKRVTREKRMLTQMEKKRVNQLKREYTYPRIAKAADVLLERLNQHKHFFLLNANPAYKGLIGNLEQISRLAVQMGPEDGKNPVNREVLRNLLIAVKNGVKESRKYLSDKQEEMERDPLRRNDQGKMKYEQPRIDAVLDAYDVLSEMALSFKARVKNTRGILQADEDRKTTFNHFLRELVTDNDDPQMAQESSQKNRLYFPERNAAGLQRLESLFGISPKKPAGLEAAEALDSLTKAGNGFAAIGAADGPGRLSDKDFAAIAIAASTTPAAMKDSWTAADPENRYAVEEKYALYAGQTLRNALAANSGNVAQTVPEIQKARNLAKQAMEDYGRGNKDTLARLLADGIRNLSGLYDGGRYDGNREMQLVSAEMGLRMKAMLERDQELMKKAMSFGLTPKMLKRLKNQGVEASNAVLADRWQAEGRQLKGEKWGIREKERNYVDLLMKRYLEEERSWSVSEMENSEQYKEKFSAVRQRYQQALADAQAARNKDRLDALKQTDAYVGTEKILTSLLEEKGQGSPAEKREAEKKVREGLEKHVDKMTEHIRRARTAYEDQLIRKHEPAMREMNKKQFPKGYEGADRAARLAKALEMERNRVNGPKPQDAEKLRKHQQDSERYQTYIRNGEVLQRVNAADEAYRRKEEQIREMGLVQLHSLKAKWVRNTPMIDSLSDAEKERNLRKRLRNFIRDKGYDRYAPKEFIEKVVGSEKKPATERRRLLLVDLICYENEKKGPAKMVTGPAKTKAGPTKTAAGAAKTKPIKPGAGQTAKGKPGGMTAGTGRKPGATAKPDKKVLS